MPESAPPDGLTGALTADFAFWQSRQHFNFGDLWQHVDFQVYSTFDVVARPGWCITQRRQIVNELWIVRAGEVEIRQNEHSHLVKAPSLAILRGGESRDTRQCGDASLSIIGFSFTANIWNALDGAALWDLPRAAPFSSRLSHLVEQMVEESRQNLPGCRVAVEGWGQLALVELLRSVGDDQTHHNLALARSGELSGALQLVATRFFKPLSVDEMARACHLSPKHFGRKFHAILGLTPMDYLRRVRLNRARALLASNDDMVAHIGRECGFPSPAHFARVFKAEFGFSPLEFRGALRSEKHGEN